jgi:short-subunit dehydrogenase
LYARIREEKDVIDVLVANSGFIDPQSLVDTTEENFDKTFDTMCADCFSPSRKRFP